MATHRPRVRTIGALIANGRKRRKKRRRRRRNKGRSRYAYRMGKGFVRKNRRKKRKRRKKRRRNRGRAYRLGKGFVRNRGRKRRRRKGRKRKNRSRRKMARYSYKRRKNRSHKRRGRKRNRRSKGRTRKRGRRSWGRKRRYKRRKNTATALGRAKQMARKLPLVGGPLAQAVGFVPAGLFAFVGAEAGLQGSAMLAQMGSNPVTDFLRGLSIPQYFALVGFVGGGLAATVASMLGLAKMRGLGLATSAVGLAFTSGAWGAAWYEYRKSQALAAAGSPDAVDQAGTASGEPTAGLGAVMIGANPLGAVMVGDMSGMGPAYTVGPQGYGSGLGAVLVGG